jgi:hypothetical protein
MPPPPTSEQKQWTPDEVQAAVLENLERLRPQINATVQTRDALYDERAVMVRIALDLAIPVDSVAAAAGVSAGRVRQWKPVGSPAE